MMIKKYGKVTIQVSKAPLADVVVIEGFAFTGSSVETAIHEAMDWAHGVLDTQVWSPKDILFAQGISLIIGTNNGP